MMQCWNNSQPLRFKLNPQSKNNLGQWWNRSSKTRHHLKIMMKLSTNLRFDESRLGSVRTAGSPVDIRRTLGQTPQECYVESVMSLSAGEYMKTNCK